MPQPVFGDVHVQAALTQIATAYLQDESAYVAEKVFPVVPVVHQADKYFKFTKGDFFRDQAQLRADATESAGSGFNLTTGAYSAGVWALHKDVGDQVRRNADPAIDLDVVTTKFLMQALLIRRERLFAATYMATSVWGTDITGVASGPSAVQTVYWSDDANGDPITDVLNAQTTILQNTGFKPNKLTIAWPVYQALRKHPLVVDRIKYTEPTFSGTITEALLARLFDVDQVLVARAVYNSALEGATDSFSFIAGKSALLTYSAPSPALMIPSAGYTFSWSGFTGMNNLGVRVLQVPMPWLGNNTIRTEAEMAFDMQVVGTDLGVFFSGIVT